MLEVANVATQDGIRAPWVLINKGIVVAGFLCEMDAFAVAQLIEAPREKPLPIVIPDRTKGKKDKRYFLVPKLSEFAHA